MFDDEKIRLIEAVPEADMILIIWIKLLTLAGKKNMNGYIFLTENIPYTDEMLATIFNRPLNTIRLALETFKKFKMINYDDNIMKITNWEKHQNIEGLDRIRKLGRLRQQKFREEQKKLPRPKEDDNVSVTLRNDIEKKRLDIDKKEKKEISFDFTKKEFIDLDSEKMKLFDIKYPDVNIDFEIEKMENWVMIQKELKDDGKRNKLPKNYNLFIQNWFLKEQYKVNEKGNKNNELI